MRVFAIFANGDLVCVDFSGERVWAKNLGLPKNNYGYASSLTVFENQVIVQYDNQEEAFLLSLNGANGKQVWKTNRKVEENWTSPIVAWDEKGAKLFVAGRPFFAAYELAKGKELWRQNFEEGEYAASPVVFFDLVTFGHSSMEIKLMNCNSGEIAWEADELESMPDVPSPIMVDDLLYNVTSMGMLGCYSLEDGKEKWNHDF